MACWHLVLINAAIAEATVAALETDLLAARAAGELDFSGLARGRSIAPVVADGRLGGQLATGTAGAHVLMITTTDEAVLRAYYEAPVHADIRRRFLSTISRDIAKLYARADSAPKQATDCFARIEELAAPIMQRIDFIAPGGS